MISPLLIALSLVTFATAQSNSTNNTALDIEAIEAHFSNAGIVPSLLSTFDPVADMAVSFDSVGQISPGQPLQQDQVATTPVVTVAPANSTVDLGANFTLVMVDADVVGTDESKGQTRHWLVNSVTLTGSSNNETVSNASATAVTEYAGPAPAEGSGAHRYVILLYSQPADFIPPANLSTPNIGVSVFSLADYVSSTNLTGPLAGMYFTVETGTASSTVSATSAVITSTLPVPSASGSSPSSTGSGNSPSTTGNTATKFSGSTGAAAAFAVLGAFALL